MLEFNISQFASYPEGRTSYNTIAEIPAQSTFHNQALAFFK